MAVPSRPQCRAARESPEEGYYSGLHSGSEVPTACPSQLFKVWLFGRVWYQWNADSLLVALVPLTSSQPLSPCLSSSLSLFRLQQFHHMQNGGASQKVFQGLEPFQPLTTMAVQMQSCDLGNSSYPAPFSNHGRRGDVVPDLRSR